MGENLGDHRGFFDGGDERQGAATVRTGGHVDFKHPFEQLCPGQARRTIGGRLEYFPRVFREQP
jgi:hypothetical protein